MEYKLKTAKTKEQARQAGIDYQYWAARQNLSYSEVAHYNDKLRKLAKKFGLIKEFKENAII